MLAVPPELDGQHRRASTILINTAEAFFTGGRYTAMKSVGITWLRAFFFSLDGSLKFSAPISPGPASIPHPRPTT